VLMQLDKDVEHAGISGYALTRIKGAIAAVTAYVNNSRALSVAKRCVKECLGQVHSNIKYDHPPKLRTTLESISSLLDEMNTALTNGNQKRFESAAEDLYKFAYSTKSPNLPSLMEDINKRIKDHPKDWQYADFGADVASLIDTLKDLFPFPPSHTPVGINDQNNITSVTDAIGNLQTALEHMVNP